ncbi:Gfo/Idh/MocA family oxidoreductase [Candidatus Woesearchaeota archaeon]|nr:Gfo/Idh/MocA family oxidoreductase [Candidatus Woesearchaeota archaeon]
MVKNLNFAIIGVGGYIAPRHLNAIKENGNTVVASVDKSDSVGIMDKYFPDASFFTEFERFDRHCEKLKQSNSNEKIDFVTVCSPNYLHDAHIRFGLRLGANVICEKPIVLNPWNIDSLINIEKETGKKVYTVLQLRYHPTIVDLKKRIEKESKNEKYEIELTYMTPRGKWYFHSWKADLEKSGGIATNIGVHFFDMLTWIFGDVIKQEVHLNETKKMSGYLQLEKANVKWFLSLDRTDLPKENLIDNKPFRSIVIDGEELEFSSGFTDLHTEVYKKTLEGKGFTISDALPSIKIVSEMRTLPVVNSSINKHPLVKK